MFWVLLVAAVLGAVIVGVVVAETYSFGNEFGDPGPNQPLGVLATIGAFGVLLLFAAPLYAASKILAAQAETIDLLQRLQPPFEERPLERGDRVVHTKLGLTGVLNGPINDGTTRMEIRMDHGGIAIYPAEALQRIGDD